MYVRMGAVVLSTILISATISGGLLHAVIPHEHGVRIADEHAGHVHAAPIEGAEVNVVWSSLHGALRAGEQEIPLVVGPLFVFLFVLLAMGAVTLMAALRYAARAAPVEPLRGRALSRGIIAYRRFA